MQELNAEKTQLLIDYLNKRIERNRTLSETYIRSGNHQLAMVTNAQAAENDYTLSYLLGLIYNE